MAFIGEKVTKLIDFRIEQEEASSRLYKAMSVWLSFNGFTGASKLFDKYSKEEAAHAEKAYSYLLDLDVMPIVPALAKPQVTFNSLKDIIDKAFDHEMLITNQCNELGKEALAVGDLMTMQLAQEYLREQTEEIAKTTYWKDRIEAFGDSEVALRLLDNEMGEA